MALEAALIEVARHIGSKKNAPSSSQLAKELGVSQQSGSRYLRALEEKGWISRSRMGRTHDVDVTPDGRRVLEKIISKIECFLHNKNAKSICGSIVSGIGEGAYYVGEYSPRIRECVGYTPYGGTLNIRSDEGRRIIPLRQGIEISPFSSGDRTFGRVKLIPVKLSRADKSVECHIIIPDRTHHRLDIEVIADRNLRKFFGAKDGDEINIFMS